MSDKNEKKVTDSVAENTNKIYSQIEQVMLANFASVLKGTVSSLAPLANSGVVKTLNLVGEKLKEISPEYIENIGRILQSESFQKLLLVSHDITYLAFLQDIKWPLFLLGDKELEKKLYILIGEDKKEQLATKIILNYFDIKYVRELSLYWDDCDVIQKERKTILKEAIKLFEQGFYYSCVSNLICQMNGIINDIAIMYDEHGDKFAKQELEEYLRYITENDELKLGKTNNEKGKLLGISKDLLAGLYYWSEAAIYIRNIIYSSEPEMSESNHPCRNKICHGEQVNFGTIEHALKAILVIDILIKNANASKEMLEER